VGPPIREPGRESWDPLPILGDLLAAERRLKPAALAVVELSFTGQQAVAQQATRALHETAFPECVRVLHQHLLHVIRMGEQKGLFPAQAKRGNVALGPRESQQESVGVGVEPG